MQRDAAQMKVRVREEGIEAAPDIPFVQVEYVFPEIDDPQIIMEAVLHYRHVFDENAAERIEYLDELGKFAENMVVQHVTWKQNLVVEKRVYFGDENTAYSWVSSVPDELAPVPAEGVVRSHRLIGFHKITKRPKGGCVFKDMFANDPKISAWAANLAFPLLMEVFAIWFRELEGFVRVNHDMLAE